MSTLTAGWMRWQKALTRLAAEAPYEKSSELFEELTGLPFSDHITHEVVGKLTKGLTVLLVSPTAAEMAQKISHVAHGKT